MIPLTDQDALARRQTALKRGEIRLEVTGLTDERLAHQNQVDAVGVDLHATQVMAGAS